MNGNDEREILGMPPEPWIDLPPDEHYAWNCALGRAIMLARDGVTTELHGPDGAAVAVIGPPGTGTLGHEARHWLATRFRGRIDTTSLNDAGVRKAIEMNYPGGWDQFTRGQADQES